MWIVIKIKNKSNFGLLKDNLKNLLDSEFKFFTPKIKIQKYKANKFISKDLLILGNYAILYHSNFSSSYILNKVRYLRGIHSVLNNFNICQNEIEQFVKKCKRNEDKEGYLSQNFFNLKKGTELKFTSGPFVNFISELIYTQKKRICLLAGKYKIMVQRNQNCILTG
tara:strand:- start:19 stop:519 length:501 start_codon:yes stop_codon:yes gene_type:complete